LSALVFGLEWRVALARRRLFLLNVAIPLLLTVPVAVSGAPAVHAAAVYAVLLVLHPTFGSAVPLVRDAEEGLLARVLRGGVGPSGLLLGRTAAGAVVDILQLLPALLVAWGGLGARSEALPVLLAATAAALGTANWVGVVVAAAARSVAETALFAAVAGLLLLHASGVFRTPVSGSVGAGLEAASPFRLLHEALLAAAQGSAPGGSAGALAWAVLLPTVLVALAGPLAQPLSGAPRRG